jgi:NAD(P)H-dependent flavin oxidoreductase YrpB (nitropropane dioxygenase family)
MNSQGAGAERPGGRQRLRTPLTELVGIEHPVVQTGMGWVAGARLVSATANAGGLGILASATMTIDELATAIGKVKTATDRPFGVNIRADATDAGDRVELMIREGVKVASFALAPKPELIARLKEAGAVVIPSVGAAKHARKVAGWGAVRAAGTPARWRRHCCCRRSSTPSASR